MRRLLLALGLSLAGLAARAAAFAGDPPAPPAPGEAQTPDALAKELESPDLDRRRRAAYELYGLGAQAARALPALARAAGDADAYVRTTAEKALAKVGEVPPTALGPELVSAWEEALPGLGALLDDERPAVRRAASVALWRAGPLPGQREVLLRAALRLLGDGDADLRANGAGLVTNVAPLLDAGTPARASAVGALVPRAKDEDDRVRRAVAEAFGALGGAEGTGPLLVLADDEVAAVRAAALTALLGVSPAGTDVTARAVAGLEDPDGTVRSAAATTVWGLAPPTAVGALVRSLTEDGEASVRAPAVSALGAIGDLRALPAVRAALADLDLGVRSAALHAFVGFGPECAPALPDVVRILRSDPEPGLRATAALALGQWQQGAAPAVPALLRALADPEPGVRSATASALFSLALADALPAATGAALLAALASSEPDVRLYAAQALLRLPRLPPGAGEALLRAFRADPAADAAPALLAALAMDESPGEAVLAALRELAGSSTPAARAAAGSLVRLGGEADRARGLELLTAALGDPQARGSALLALGAAGAAAAPADAAVAARFREARDAPARAPRLAPATALARMEGPSAPQGVEALLDALRGDDALLARLAAVELGTLRALPPRAILALLDRLEPDAAEPGLCLAAARALGRLAPPEASVLDRLARAAAIPERADLRWAATAALLRIAAR